MTGPTTSGRARPTCGAMLLLIFVATALLRPAPVWAWGAGHRYQGEILLEMLPEEIRDFLGTADALLENMSYPDSFQLFAEEPRRPAGFENDWQDQLQGDLEILQRYDIAHPYALHSARGKAVSFILMTRAFRDRHSGRAGFWMACLAHAIGDESAFNHGPLIHYLTYALRPYQTEMGGKGIGVDLVDLQRRREGRAKVEEGKRHFVPTVLADCPDQALVHILLAGVRGNDYMVQREGAVAATYALDAREDDVCRGLGAMAEVGLFGACEAADAALTAWQFAQDGIAPELTPAIYEHFQEKERAYLQQKPLERDAIFADLLGGLPGEQVVGVVVEPSQTMNRALFSFGAKYIQSAVMRELQDQRIAYQPLDARRIEKDGLPDPSCMPVVIVCAGPFRVSEPARQQFRQYAEAGGRFLWIGGQDAGLLGDLSGALADTSDDLLPVSRRYGDTPGRFEQIVSRLEINFKGAFAESLGDRPYRFHNNPNTQAGWQKPVCTLSIDAVDEGPVSILATITKGDRTIAIAGALMEQGRARHIFLPEYLLSPYLFSGENRLDNPAQPVLDVAGRKILAASLAQIAPRP